MSSAIATAIDGINNSVARATQDAGNIVNASSTGKNIDGDLIDIRRQSVSVAADAKVIRAAQKEQKALLDIVV